MLSGVYSRDLAAKFLTCPTALEGQCKQVTVAPDVMHEVIRAYQATCAVLIHRFDEHIAQYLADGLLVYLV